MDDIKSFIIKHWLGVAFGSVVAAPGAIYRYFSCKEKRRKEELNDIREEIQLLKMANRTALSDRLGHLCRVALEKGFCTIEERRDISEVFKAYDSLGGNGFRKEQYQDVMELPYERR